MLCRGYKLEYFMLSRFMIPIPGSTLQYTELSLQAKSPLTL